MEQSASNTNLMSCIGKGVRQSALKSKGGAILGKRNLPVLVTQPPLSAMALGWLHLPLIQEELGISQSTSNTKRTSCAGTCCKAGYCCLSMQSSNETERLA